MLGARVLDGVLARVVLAVGVAPLVAGRVMAKPIHPGPLFVRCVPESQRFSREDKWGVFARFEDEPRAPLSTFPSRSAAQDWRDKNNRDQGKATKPKARRKRA